MNVPEYPMQAIAPTVARLLGTPPPGAVEAGPIQAIVDDLEGVERVAILGVDALGLAIYQHWRADMPFLTGLFQRAFATVRSILPSKTVVNFGCMVTGASLDVHGALTRDTPFACETLFDVLRASGMTTAGMGRKGWTGNELLGRHAGLSTQGKAENDQEVEALLIPMIYDRRPHFIIVQYGLTDEQFHRHGPYADEVRSAVIAADAWLQRCVTALRANGYGIIILADHGQHPIETEDNGRRGTHGDSTDEDCVVPLTWTR